MTSKVLWGEGLLLRPQHFQRQDAYHEHCLFKSVKAVHPYAWGVELARSTAKRWPAACCA